MERLDEIVPCYERLYTGELSPLKPQARSWAVIELGARMLLAILGMDEASAHTGILKVAQLSAMRRQAEGIDYVQRLLDIVQEAVARDPAGFGAAAGYDSKPRQGNKGKVLAEDGDGNVTELAVLPEFLKGLTAKSGLPDLTGALVEARERGVLATDRDKLRLTKTERIAGIPTKCYVFNLPGEPEANRVTTVVTNGGNSSEANFQGCYHRPVFVTTVTTKNMAHLYISRELNIGGNGGNSGNKERNTIKNTNNSVTTAVTTGGNTDSGGNQSNPPAQSPNGSSVEV